MSFAPEVTRRAGFAPPLRHVRGALLASSVAELRARGLESAYRRALDPAAEHALLISPITQTWLPVSLALSHFAACNAIVSPEVAFAIGASSGTRVQESVISTIVKVATGAGASPWTALAHYPRLWGRIFDGGSATVTKMGPKDALVTIDDFPLARFAYFRHAFRGTHDAVVRLFASTVFVNEVPRHSTTTSFRYGIAWA